MKRLKTMAPFIAIGVCIGGFLLYMIAPAARPATADVAFSNKLTVVIDAGHGGEDGGAVAPSGMKESAINLAVAERLDLILAFYGVPTVMTRTAEQLDYSAGADTIREKKREDQRRRLALIKATDNAVLISIHQNNFPDGRPFGAQVLYAPTPASKELAESMQALLIGALNTENYRVADQIPNSIMLLNNIDCPGILIECGFLSNAAEEKLLQTDAYRLKIATVIAAGYLAERETIEIIIIGGTNEAENSLLLYGLRQ